jgi:superfamily I DNA and RNA helicase
MTGRNLSVNLNVVTFAPAVPKLPEIDTDHPLCNDITLESWISTTPQDNGKAYQATLEVIQSISSIRKGRKRRVSNISNSRGSKLKALEDSIANLDSRQGQAVIETVEGVQRIRGLAGSGKTIILALKAAYLHAQHPEWNIAVTFNTRSLKGQFKRLINTFFIEQTSEEPDWTKLQILQAWGAPGGIDRNGLYYSYCKAPGSTFFDFMGAKSQFGSNREFEGACNRAMQSLPPSKPLYDVILVDEAQDFSPVFLRMCYAMLPPEKRLVYAYDELQNLNNSSLPSPEEIFGKNADGAPVVSFAPWMPGMPRQDIILQKCYRNSRPLLATAHALGFGIYRTPVPPQETGLIQMFDQPSLWEEVGYSIAEGALEENSAVVLERTPESSPLFLENHSPIDDLVQFIEFESIEKQAEWLAQEIRKNLEEDELASDDIVVINQDPLTTRDAVGLPRKLLFDAGINSHLTGVDTSPDVFFDNDGASVAFTGIFRAKGNEAGMVYVLNAQDCAAAFGNSARMRNRLFTAITRSKAWVRILGVGPHMRALMKEFDAVKAANFQLRFRYPTAAERAHLNIVNRDMTIEEKKRVRGGARNLATLVKQLVAGEIFIEDLPRDEVDMLRNLLASKEK